MEIRPIISALLRSKTGAILVALQVAISLAILANALHIVNLRLAVAARPSGIADEASMLYIETRHLRKGEHNEQIAQQKAEVAALRALPGVRAVAGVNQIPMTQSGINTSVAADRKQVNQSASPAYYYSGESLVDTFGLKLVEGRDFRADEVIEVDNEKDSDNETSRPRAIIVTRALAEKVWPNQHSYVGKTLYYGTGADAQGGPVVGVVETLQSQSAQVDQRGEYSTIVPMRLSNGFGTIYAVRAEPGQLDRLMKETEAALLRSSAEPMIVRVKTVSKARQDRYRADLALSWMLVTVSALLLLITASGIVGISSLWVSQRRKQIGVRRALGARRLDILRYFLLENFMITSAGVASGVLLALGLNQLLVAQLEMARLPLGYLLGGAAVFWALGALAVYGPAWRAASISPATATRSA